MTPLACSHNRRIHVVEDDPMIGGLIADVLTAEGFEPFVVRDGQEALRTVHAAHPDVVTLDLELPGIDGHAILRHLTEDGGRHVPVVVVSAATETLSREERRGVSQALQKPFEVPDLLHALAHAVAHA